MGKLTTPEHNIGRCIQKSFLRERADAFVIEGRILRINVIEQLSELNDLIRACQRDEHFILESVSNNSVCGFPGC
jgi:hypothetical protein